MIKVVIFDVGGVLVRTNDHSHRRYWENRLGLQEGESEEIVFNSAMGQKAQIGEISDEELWAWVGQQLDLGEDLDAFRSAFWAGDVLDTKLISFVRTLRPAYQTAIISNATDSLRETLGDKFQIADAFDLIVGSAEEKVMKPDHRIYQIALDRLGCHPVEAVFIDDFAHNISAAQNLGLATIHYKVGTDISEELARLNVWPVIAKEA